MQDYLTSWSLFLVLLFGSNLFHGSHTVLAKEVEVTKEWQLLGETDTIPAGMHVRMDMTTGEKWVKLIDEDEDDGGTNVAAAIIQEDGSVQVQEVAEKTVSDDKTEGYQYEMMHRTLSKLPEKEKERMGGLPELPQGSGSIPLISKEREMFEKRMVEIWEKRQAELKEHQEHLIDLPEVLKERIRSIEKYLKDPLSHLNEMDLDGEQPVGHVTHIVSVLQDLEYQLADIDMARDFHTLGGWQLLVSLVSEEIHLTQNMTISRLSRKTEAKIRAVQAQAAWAIGTAVKNTAEFNPFAVEKLKIGDSTGTTAIDLLIDTFCRDHKDPHTWEVRTLLGKSLFGIGSLLRGNRIAQIHVSQGDDPGRLGEKLRQLSLDQFTSANTKLIQKMLALESDLVSGIHLHGDESMEEQNKAIVDTFTSSDWCDSTSDVLVTDLFLPVPVQETLLKTVEVIAPHCNWDEKVEDHQKAIEKIQAEWQTNKDDFDPEHLEQMNVLATQAVGSLAKKSL
jgi:nucleotide exchange factor SIL1